MISIAFSARKTLISENQGTDYSGKNRIKYEVWESKAIVDITIVIIHPNANIAQTLERAADEINFKKINISQLLVLSETSKRESLKSYLINKNRERYGSMQCKEITFSEFIWDSCINNDFQSDEDLPVVNHYTDQELKDTEGTYPSALVELSKALSSNSYFSIFLLVGDGGNGKSSLCYSLYSELKQQNNIVPFLISSEAITSFVEETKYTPDSITSIFDLYEIQARCDEQANILDRKRFEISLCAGSIVIIIDGLDEFPSIFGDKFDTIKLLQSINESHAQLGKSRVLITSRDTKLFTDDSFHDLDIKRYELLGFKERDCKKYIRKRFRDESNLDKTIDTILDVFKDNDFKSKDRVIPFILLSICNIYEKSDNTDKFKESVSSKALPFLCLNTLTDNIIYAIFKREEQRQKVPIPALEMLYFFAEFSARFGPSWPIVEVESELKLYYDEKAESILKAFRLNDLIKFSNNVLTLKYDFTLSYFKSLYYMDLFYNFKYVNECITALARIRVKSKEVSDLFKFINNSEKEVLDCILPIVNALKAEPQSSDKKLKQKIMASIENIFSMTLLDKGIKDKENATELLKSFFSNKQRNTIDNCYIKGDIPPLDFSGLTIINSRFSSMQRFLQSNFINSSFMYTEFNQCNNPLINDKNILDAEIDKNTCVLGDLVDAINSKIKLNENDYLHLESEAKKFLSSFRKGLGFKDVKIDYIKFSTSVDGLSKTNFDKLRREGFISIKYEKENEKFYIIDPSFKDSVQSFMTNNQPDHMIDRFLDFVGT
ncbi:MULTISPECIES: NACHT domain-containing protein [Pseudoalteromonas]|uniref:NACHT domain-containing protein n=1 Tax=Pseudoalteromonas lipolytica TaxID=570156 RepID=A0ABY1GC86_9GAMM|nr:MULTISPECIES: NACHT domain-containing protein [Pseudoalteromonas]MBE0351396.1 hypothetical protein [Pseudoalteromonas lipolytica LMEB 39]QLJ09332.1 NACHT domain-containing protein [Pseudoalteromonas sp. JSTW]SFT45371.1 NACHT domain-containing protein [Pseudoalteromonas lipolytica]